MSKKSQKKKNDELEDRKRGDIDIEKIRRSAQKVKRIEKEFLNEQNVSS